MRYPTFSRESFERTARVVRQVERQDLFTQTRPPRGLMTGLATYICKTGGSGIPAMSGTTPGSATVTLQRITGGSLVDATDDGGADVTKTCLNLSTTAVGADGYILAQQELLSGNLIAVWEDCPGA